MTPFGARAQFLTEMETIFTKAREELARAQAAGWGKPLPAFFPSHDRRILLQTERTVSKIEGILQRPLISETCGGIGQAVSMNGMVRFWSAKVERSGLPGIITGEKGHRKTRGLWIEDDIGLAEVQAEEIALMITEADRHGWNMVAPYATGFRETGEFNWVYFKMPNEETGEIGRPFTEDEIRALKPFDELHGLAGLGFYYGDIYVDYIWYEGNFNGRDRFGFPSYGGIDWNYFLDNHIELRHYPVVIYHEKTVSFSNAKVIENWGGDILQKASPPLTKGTMKTAA